MITAEELRELADKLDDADNLEAQADGLANELDEMYRRITWFENTQGHMQAQLDEQEVLIRELRSDRDAYRNQRGLDLERILSLEIERKELVKELGRA